MCSTSTSRTLAGPTSCALSRPTILCALVLLALSHRTTLAGSQLYPSASGSLETIYNDPVNATSFGQSSGQGSGVGYLADFYLPEYNYGWTMQDAIEFNLSSIHGPVQSATLSLYVSDALVNGVQFGEPNGIWNSQIGFGVAGYAGSGQVTQSDFTQSTFAGFGNGYLNPTVNFSSFIYPINIDITTLINGLVSHGDQFAGFVLSIDEPDANASGPIIFDFAGGGPWALPTLTLNAPPPFSNPISVGITSVPEPSSSLTLGIGIAGLTAAGALRRRQRAR